ncbi:MAG TPA: hydrogen peroxide-dependent heme synthase [Bacilli bacterium]
MSEATLTLEGWYALHDFRTIDWSAWQDATAAVRKQAETAMDDFLGKWDEVERRKAGSSIMYAIVGQKADIMMVHLRESLEQLQELETAFNKSAFARFAHPAYSYVSVVELSNYMSKPGEDPYKVPEIAARLRPMLPKTKHVCFYPMNKRRAQDANWYMLSMDERRQLMRGHGEIGRTYAGKVRQIITGSIGFDAWEWGVTLFADDALQFKKLIYEMRFDEASARYAEFGDFYVGNILNKASLHRMLAVAE